LRIGAFEFFHFVLLKRGTKSPKNYHERVDKRNGFEEPGPLPPGAGLYRLE
jgi:hypothetical protein